MGHSFSGMSFPEMKNFAPAGITPAKACQWIEGAPSENDACKCGALVQEGTSYCNFHYERSVDRSPRAKFVKNLYKPKKEGDDNKAIPSSFQSKTTPAATD